MGSHPVSLKITYSERLQNSDEITINHTLELLTVSHTRGDRHGQNTNIPGIPLPVIILMLLQSLDLSL